MSSPRISRACSSASSGPVGELHAAGLAAPAGQHLRLDDDRSAELLRRRARLLAASSPAAVRHGDAEAREELLALVLVQVHPAGESTPEPPANCQASLRVGSMDAIVVDGLEKTYGKDVRALDGMRSRSARARSSACSARTAPASLPPSGSL